MTDSWHQTAWPTPIGWLDPLSPAPGVLAEVKWTLQLVVDSLPHPQISDLTSELTDERNTGESASQLLDAETAERLRAEREMKELQVRAGPG